MNEVVAIIPARSGSKSIIDKNITPLSGYPIIAYSLIAAQLSKNISRVIVSTDSKEYAKIAKLFGAEVPFIRPKEISTDDSTDRDFFLHAMKWLEENEGSIPEYFVHLRPTTPLREYYIIDDAINILKNSSEATSLRSGHPSPESPLKWFTLNEEGFFKGLLPSNNNLEYYNQPKERFDTVFIPNGYVDIVKSSHVMNSNNLHGENMIGFETKVCTEIDSIEELDYIQFQLNRDGSLLLDELNLKY